MHGNQLATEQGFPRAYRVNERTRHSINFLLCALAGLFVFFTIMGLIQDRSRPSALAPLLIMDLAMAGLILWLSSSNNKRAVLHADAVEVTSWFYSRKLYFAEIRGRQTTANPRLPYGYAYIFLPTDSRKRKLFLPGRLQTDQFFRDWIKTVPQIPR